MKKFFTRYIGALYFSQRFFGAGILCAALFFTRHFVPPLAILPWIVFLAFCIVTIVEYIILFMPTKPFQAVRTHAARLSNGDDNEINIFLENHYRAAVKVTVYDEVPAQFQKRDATFSTAMQPGENKQFRYMLRPTKRGQYSWGIINSYVSCLAGLIRRRFKSGMPASVAVYPSYLQLRKYQILALNHHLRDTGQKKQRQMGQSFELEQIKEYVPGDDFRTINWKASARKGQFMVNNYTDEKSQPVYCIIDKGRLMEMPFNGMTLLDYAINASLVLSYVAIFREDKAGLITFDKRVNNIIPADKRTGIMPLIQEALYNQKADFPESSFEHLYTTIRHKIKQRSLLVLFTNFASIEGMKRQLPYLRKLTESHLLLVVFFQNTVLENLVTDPAHRVKDIYTQTVAEQLYEEKHQIIRELQRHGILALLTLPENLTVNTVNRYLKIKSKRAL
ncbi:MAG: DUF58 domain-containing protein [Niabella sp.]